MARGRHNDALDTDMCIERRPLTCTITYIAGMHVLEEPRCLCLSASTSGVFGATSSSNCT
eukprot:scaffold9048_cov31-Tisochrysis_lutea.AAC.3